MKKYLPFLLLMLIVSGVSYGQNQKEKARVLEATNVETLQKRAKRLKIKAEREKRQAVAMAREKGWIIRKTLDNGTVMEIQRIENGEPVYYITHNYTASQTISTNAVWDGGAAGLDLSGEGYVAGVWDGGKVRASHQEFDDRVSQQDNASDLGDHATHVSGTIGASGVDEDAKGMAPQATIHAYDWSSDLSEMTAAASNGLLLSNHSYGIPAGYSYNGGWNWNGNSSISNEEDYMFGFYNTTARAWDEMTMDAPYYLPVVSAGNDRGEGPGNGDHPDDGEADNGYDCISGRALAKNVMAVANVQDIPAGYTTPSDVSANPSSSWGPADDGRVKPDIAANGTGLYSSTAANDQAYASYSGTSMSAPSVTGSMLLLQEHYNELYENFMKAATLKGLVIHTADEAGEHEGPDYKYGWGLMNTQKAAEIISKNQVHTFLREETLEDGNTYEFQVYSEGNSPLKVTLSWTDPQGTPTSAQLDPRTAMLVNDLDMTVTSPSNSTYQPYFLDPENPAQAAQTGDNDVDNVEHVNISNPENGVYTIRVNHEGNLTNGKQDFSLIVSEIVASSPGSFLASAQSSTEIELNWNLNLDGDEVLVAYSDSNNIGNVEPGVAYLPGDSIGGGVTLFQGTNTSFLHTHLASGQMYHYKAWSVDADTNYSVHVVDSARTQYDVIFADDFEGDQGWSLTGEFERDEPAGLGGNEGNPDPTTAYQGTKVLGTDLTGLGNTGGNPAGDYAGNLSDRAYKAVSPLVDCENASGVFLSFQRWLNVEEPELDSVQIDISNDGGNTWKNIYYNDREITESSWSMQELDISQYADGKENVQIRFTVGETDLGGFYSGWNVDMFQVKGMIPRYPLTFQVQDTEGNPIDSAFLELNGTTAFADEAGELTLPDVKKGSRPFVVRKPGYGNYYDTLNVTHSDTIAVIMETGTAGFQVNMTVLNGDTAIEGATVDFNDETQTTNSAGAVAFDSIPVGTHPFVITSNGHQQTGALEVADRNVDTTLQLTYQVLFAIDDGTDPLENAVVNLQGYGDSLTNASGEVAFEGVIAEKGIAYEVSADGFDDTTGTVDVSNKDVSVQLSLKPSNLVTFVVQGDDGPAIDSARIVISGEDTLYTGENGRDSIYLSGGTHHYTVSADGYFPLQDSLIAGDKDQTITVTLQKAYTVTLNVTDGERPVPGAAVSFATKTLMTGEQGLVKMDTVQGEFDYSISKEGYLDTSGTLTVTGNVEKTIALQRINEVVFRISDDDQALENAQIDFAGKTVLTGAAGEATIDTVNGTYAYTVTKADYQEYAGSVNVYNNDTTISIDLIATGLTMQQHEPMQVYPNPAHNKLFVESAQVRDATVIIRNSTGKVLLRKKLEQQRMRSFDIGSFPAGLYLIEVQAKDFQYLRKVIFY